VIIRGSVAVLVGLVAVSVTAAGQLVGTVKAVGARDGANAVVYVAAVPGRTFQAPKEHARMDQKDMEFVPHVLPVLVGTTVEFLNSDPFLHNVFTPDKCAERFNLGSWPTGKVRSYTFKQPCVATILCNVHPEMEAFVVVVPTPYFAVTDKSGAFVIRNVPDGTYTVKVWHPKLKEITRQVTVTGETSLDVQLEK